MSAEKPLHVQVAEALGWTLEAAAHDHACGTPPPWIDLESLNVCANIGTRKFYAVPLYDRDWGATGPLIERFRMHGEMRMDPQCHEPQWCLFQIPPGDEDIIESGPHASALLAFCHLILALHAAGKLGVRAGSGVEGTTLGQEKPGE